MQIHIDQLIEKELSLEFKEKPDSFPVLAQMIKEGGCGFPVSIDIRLRVFRISEIIEVEGAFETRVHQACGRCLVEFEKPLNSRFTLTYTPEYQGNVEDLSRDEVELSPEDAGLIKFSGDRIDLRDGIQEQIVMALPLRTLCGKDCKGLCSQCGADLNKGDCGCDHVPTNTQFSALKNLKL